MTITDYKIGNEGSVLINIGCTEREAREIAHALAIQADIRFGVTKNSHEVDELYRQMLHHAKQSDKWAKEIFEKVGY